MPSPTNQRYLTTIWRDADEDDENYLKYKWNIGRSYVTFARLADVRNYDGIRPLADPRGIPHDLTAAVRLGLSECADHSFTWFTLDQLLGEDLGYTAFEEMLNCLPFLTGTEPKDIRLTMGFDN